MKHITPGYEEEKLTREKGKLLHITHQSAPLQV